MKELLRIEHLKTHFSTEAGLVRAVDGVSFHVREGETVCIVGESGCGKSITAMSVMGLVQGGKVVEGSIEFDGRDLLGLSRNERRTVRGNDISMIFQEPMSSLNPVLKIGEQIAEPLMERSEAGPQGGETACSRADHAGGHCPGGANIGLLSP